MPKSAQPWVATMVRTIFDQPDAASVRDQYSRVGGGDRGDELAGGEEILL